jgi:hypothetical protein
VTGKKTPARNGFILNDPTGAPFAQNLSAEAFCSGLRQLVQAATDTTELEALARYNKAVIARLRTEAPNLRTSKDLHYADVLERLIKERLASSSPSPAANGHDSPHPQVEARPAACSPPHPPEPPLGP